MDDLLLEGLEEAFGDAVGLRLLDEGVAHRDPPEAHLVAEVLGDVLRAVVHAQGEPPACVRGHAAELREQPLRDGLQRREAVAAFADVAADDLAVEVVDGREDPAHALLGGEHARTVGAPHDARGVGGDPAVVARAPTLAHAARREQAVLAHEAQDAPPRGAHASDAQARPDLAVALAAERRALEVVRDQGVELLVCDRGSRAPAGRRGAGRRGVEGRARHAPDRAHALDAVGPAAGDGDRRALALRPPPGQRAGTLDPRVQQLVLHGELADAAHGGVELALEGIALALLEPGVHAGQSLVFPALEAVDLDAELAGERVERLSAQQPQRHLTLAREAPALPRSKWAQGHEVTLGLWVLLCHDGPFSRTLMLHKLVSRRSGAAASVSRVLRRPHNPCSM